jgi:hypothetical protein
MDHDKLYDELEKYKKMCDLYEKRVKRVGILAMATAAFAVLIAIAALIQLHYR